MRALIVDTVLLVSIVSLAHPVVKFVYSGGVNVRVAVGLPAGVIVYYFLLALVFLRRPECSPAPSTTAGSPGFGGAGPRLAAC